MTREEIAQILSLNPQTGTEEAYVLYTEVDKLSPKVIVEIGVDKGSSLLLWSKLLWSDGLLVGIDAYSCCSWDTKSTRCKTVLVIGDTFKEETLNSVKEALGGRSIDFLRIDGGHSYDAVKNDFVRYSPLVRAGGIIAFHDYLSSVEVKRFVDEIWSQYRSVRIPDTDSTYLFK